MTENLSLTPTGVEFDPRLADQLARTLATVPTVDGDTYPTAERRRTPFKGYVRILTPEGGVLILYKDQDCSLFWTVLRVFTWIVATGLGGWLLLFLGPLNLVEWLLGLTGVGGMNFLIVRQAVEASHSVEIRADAMIVDGKDVFYAKDIGDTWPELQKKSDKPDQMVIAGICGTRFIEFMTANRLDDESDRTPEVLAADLKAAMEQLWGRREVTFPAGP